MKQPVKLGALSLLLSIVVVCLVTLSVLTLATAHADYTLAQRQAQNVQQLYAAQALAATWLSETEAALQSGAPLPQGTVQEGSTLSVDAGDGSGHTMHVVLDVGQTPHRILCWQAKNTMGTREGLPALYTGE